MMLSYVNHFKKVLRVENKKKTRLLFTVKMDYTLE